MLVIQGWEDSVIYRARRSADTSVTMIEHLGRIVQNSYAGP